MLYFLYHKNIPVLSFETEYDEISKVNEILNKEHLPVGVFREFERGTSQTKQFQQWWRNRAIPASRQNLTDALELLGNITSEQLVTKSYGLSLSDHYWAKPYNNNLKWEDVNFFENAFSEDVGKALFGTLDVEDLSNVSLISPDNTSDGWLKKKWIIDNGERVLLKGGSGPFVQEPFNEVLASKICDCLNIPHVDYLIVQNEGRFFSACKDFITTNTELISAWHIRKIQPKSNNESEYNHLINCCKILGMKNIPEIEKQICNTMVVDSIMANTDRHFNNFGFIRNPLTLEWQGLAPVFDTGTSMFLNEALSNLTSGNATLFYNLKSKPFAKNHNEQIKRLPCDNYCSQLPFENLNEIDITFENIFSQNGEFPANRKNILCTILKDRVQETKNLILHPEIKRKEIKQNSLWEQ